MSSIPAAEPKPKAGKSRKSEKGDVPGVTRPMTYEEYLASPEEMRRYDIIDGYKIYYVFGYGENQMTNPTRDHQRVLRRIARPFEDYEERTQAGQAFVSPCDVLIRRNPTRTRQSDVLFISNERLSENAPSDNPAPLSPAPELAVEILSPSDTRRVRQNKLNDYAAVDVCECWLVSLEAETVEVLRRAGGAFETVAVYGRGQVVSSVTFRNLAVAVSDIFAVATAA